MARFLFPFAAAAVACVLFLAGIFDPLTYRLIDQQFRWIPRAATGQIVIVEIDPVSLHQIGVWPWPRSLHGQVLQQLEDAGATSVVMDVDFAAASQQEEDFAFARALADAAVPVTLPVFRQYSEATRDNATSLVASAPLPLFRHFVRLASANLRPGPDGLVWRSTAVDQWEDSQWPTLAAELAAAFSVDAASFIVDFGIVPGSIESLSYVDVLTGSFDHRIVEGRRVIIAATAIELGDTVAVPAWRTLPGGYVQVLAAESLMQGRTLSLTPSWITILVMIVIGFASVRIYAAQRWLVGLITLVGQSILLLIASAATYAAFPHLITVVPWIGALILAYVAALALRIDDQTLRLFLLAFDLRRKIAFMGRVAEHAFDGLVTTDRSGRILTFSKSAQRIFGYTASQAVDMQLDQICRLEPPDRRDDDPQPDAAPWSSLVGRARFETIGHCANGVSIPIDIAVTSLPEDGGATLIFVIRDVSERKAAEAGEAQARGRLADAVENSPCGFALFDAEDRLVLCNTKYRDFFSAAADTVVPGVSLREIILDQAGATGVSASQVHQSLAFWMGSGAINDFQLPDGRWLSVGRRRTADGGSVFIVNDTTVPRERELELARAKKAAEQANKAKSEFLATVSHELRTPLNAVIGFSQMMVEKVFGGLGDPHYEEYVEDIKTSGEYLLNIINMILDFSKIDSGAMEIREDVVELDKMIKKCDKLTKPTAERKHITTELTFDAGSTNLLGDSALLSKALLNVISNAVKFTPEGGKVTIDSGRNVEGDFVLRIRDTGIGIADQDVAKALEPFQQIDSTLSRQYEGTGLGLPLAKAAVELHGGTLSLDSELGVGTTVTIRLPGSRSCDASSIAAE